VQLALENELRRADEAVSLWMRLKPLRQKIAAYPDTGLAADKAFFDELSGDY
jgi:antitoxin VapB